MVGSRDDVFCSWGITLTDFIFSAEGLLRFLATSSQPAECTVLTAGFFLKFEVLFFSVGIFGFGD